jgi:hypothetical protein
MTLVKTTRNKNVSSPRAILAAIRAILASRDVPGIATRYVAVIRCVKAGNP